MKRKAALLAGLCAVVFAFALVARADDNAKVAGTWEMTMTGGGPGGGGGGGQAPPPSTLTIEQNGDKIKGTIKGARGETPFEGTVKGKEISFTVKRQGRDGNEITIEYKGTVDGDTIKGTMGITGGQMQREWTAKKSK